MSSGTRTRPERKGWEKISFQQHVDRVKKSTPTVDCGPPRPHPLGNRREMEKVRLQWCTMWYSSDRANVTLINIYSGGTTT